MTAKAGTGDNKMTSENLHAGDVPVGVERTIYSRGRLLILGSAMSMVWMSAVSAGRRQVVM
jgi:hypothetical protein